MSPAAAGLGAQELDGLTHQGFSERHAAVEHAADLLSALDDDAPEHVALLGDARRCARADFALQPQAQGPVIGAGLAMAFEKLSSGDQGRT